MAYYSERDVKEIVEEVAIGSKIAVKIGLLDLIHKQEKMGLTSDLILKNIKRELEC